jgi:hypothetical protein
LQSLSRGRLCAPHLGDLYEECRKALPTVSALRNLASKSIFMTRDRGLLEAMTSVGQAPVFVRDATGSRDKDRAPLPPSLASKFAILNDAIAMTPEVVSDFLKAGLLRRYDPLHALQSVQSTFGDKPAPKRRQAALKWAFDVWRSEGPKSERYSRRLIFTSRHAADGNQPARRDSRRMDFGRAKAVDLPLRAAAVSTARAADLLLLQEPDWAQSQRAAASSGSNSCARRAFGTACRF